jgi:ribosome biogenesis protein NSA1
MQAVDEDERLLAVACRGTELTLWDLATRQRAYLAKSAKPDRVGLVEPPWCTAVAFVPGSSGTKVLHLSCRPCKIPPLSSH